MKKDFRNLIPVTGDVDTQLSFLPPEKVSYTYLTRASNHNLENQVIENKLKYNDFLLTQEETKKLSLNCLMSVAYNMN